MTELVGADGKTLKAGGPDGKEVKANTIPVVYWNEFVMPIRILSKEDSVTLGTAVTPTEVIKELRAGYIEMVDRFTLLAGGFAAIAKQNPGGEVDNYLSQIGLAVTDLTGKSMFEPNAKYQVKPDSNPAG